MDEQYLENLDQEERASWGFQVVIRLWLSGMCQSQVAQNWTIGQLAILFEVVQAHLFSEDPHTATSISRELNMPIQTVSRNVRDLQKMGLIEQIASTRDARKKWLCPTADFVARNAMGEIVRSFAKDWYHGWDALDKAHGAAWYYPMSKCNNETTQEEVKRFKKMTKGD